MTNRRFIILIIIALGVALYFAERGEFEIHSSEATARTLSTTTPKGMTREAKKRGSCTINTNVEKDIEWQESKWYPLYQRHRGKAVVILTLKAEKPCRARSRTELLYDLEVECQGFRSKEKCKNDINAAIEKQVSKVRSKQLRAATVEELIRMGR